MRARSGHIIFDKKVKYKSLVPIFRDLLMTFLDETGQMPEGEPEYAQIILEENIRDLRNNRKPEGYNREGSMRLIFPMSDNPQFYVYSRGKSPEVARVTEVLARILARHGLKYRIEWDKMMLFAEKK